MKITHLECVPLTLPPKDRPGRILLVKIHTDEGITGLGDAGGVNDEAAIMMFKAWSRVLIGADPLDRTRIMSVIKQLDSFHLRRIVSGGGSDHRFCLVGPGGQGAEPTGLQFTRRKSPGKAAL